MENYIPSHLFEKIYSNRGIEIKLPELQPNDNVPEIVSKHVYEARYPGCRWEDFDGDKSNYHKGVKRSEEHTSELQSRGHLVCRLLLEKKNKTTPRVPVCRTRTACIRRTRTRRNGGRVIHPTTLRDCIRWRWRGKRLPARTPSRAGGSQ